MVKRKVGQEANGKVIRQQDDQDMDSGSGDDASLLNVDFEFFSPSEIDFHGLKILFRQLLDVDAELIDLSALSNLLISQPGLGTTVKCDGNDSDPFAFISVLNLREHAATPVVQQLTSYITQRSAANPALQPLASLLGSGGAAEGKHVGLVLSERLINMPAEIAPPMLNMLVEELADVVAQGEDYAFSHLVVLSKTYAETESVLGGDEDDDEGDDAAAGRPKKKRKGKALAGGNGGRSVDDVYYFHAEDEVLGRHAEFKGGFDFQNVERSTSDARRAFQDAGIVPRGHVMVIEMAKFAAAVKAVGEYLAAGS